MLLFALLGLVAVASGYQPGGVPWHRPRSIRTARGQPIVMKGKGSRGMPGKATEGRTGGGGITTKAKKKFDVRDFNEKSEWTLVAEKDELGPEIGATKAVAAGVAPQGQEYIWTLIRGVPSKAGCDPEESTCYITDGSCRVCQFPMTQGKVQERVAADGSQ